VPSHGLRAVEVRHRMTAPPEELFDDRDLALAHGFGRGDDDPRPIAGIHEAELLAGFGESE